jgi:hypothetical protein
MANDSHPGFLNATMANSEFRSHAVFMVRSALIALGLFVFLCFRSPRNRTNRYFRQITEDINNATGPVDHFFDLSVGTDYPGTLIRDDSHASRVHLAICSHEEASHSSPH